MGDRSSEIDNAIRYQLEGWVNNWSGRINKDLEQFYVWNIWNEGKEEGKKE
jgi:hypothetical protein